MGKELLLLRSVEAIEGYRLRLRFEGMEASMTISLAEAIRAGSAFESLADPAKFRAVTMDRHRRTIVWPEPVDHLGAPLIDIDADALFQMAQEQRLETSPAA